MQPRHSLENKKRGAEEYTAIHVCYPSLTPRISDFSFGFLLVLALAINQLMHALHGNHDPEVDHSLG